jgi:metal-responsive CopG/Arc/MetJ family transcriptional regulator
MGRRKLEKVPYTATMNGETLKALDAAALAIGRTRSDVIQELVQFYLKSRDSEMAAAKERPKRTKPK